MVDIGDNVFIGSYSWLASRMKIGNWVMLAGRVAAVGGDHRMDVVGVPMIQAGRDENLTIVIEDDVWIGYGATILHGVTIGEGCVVGAGSVVTKDIPPYSIAAGVPARVIRRRFSCQQDIDRHESILAKMRNRGI